MILGGGGGMADLYSENDPDASEFVTDTEDLANMFIIGADVAHPLPSRWASKQSRNELSSTQWHQN